jgi:hypothetical protein
MLDPWTGAVWDDKVSGNARSFAEVYSLNADADPSALQQMIARAHSAAWTGLQQAQQAQQAQRRGGEEVVETEEERRVRMRF